MNRVRATSVGVGILVLGLSACQDPFPTDRDFSPQKPAPKEAPVVMPYSVEVPAFMQFREGETAEYEIKARVPAPGSALIEVVGLPEGAFFSRSTSKLAWTPDYEAGNDPDDEGAMLRPYLAKVRVSSTASPDIVLEEPIVLWVLDALREVTIDLPASQEIKEGDTFSHLMTIDSPDFPNGPFLPSVSPPVEGLRIDEVPGRSNAFKIHYTPGFKTVLKNHSSDAQGFYRDLSMTFRVALPRGAAQIRTVKWRVRDQRQVPKISGPTEITDSHDITFSLSAEDLNGEQDPQITIVQRPAYGRVEHQPLLAPSKIGAPKLAGMTVRWRDIPPSQYGKEGVFVFKACVAPLANGLSLCGSHTLKITLSGETHLPPEINRQYWPMGKLKELTVGDTLHVPLEVLDAETGVPLEEALIEAPGVEDQIAWTNGVLTIVGKTPGIKQFNVKAYSEYGVGRTEAMVYQVLPSKEEGP